MRRPKIRPQHPLQLEQLKLIARSHVRSARCFPYVFKGSPQTEKLTRQS